MFDIKKIYFKLNNYEINIDVNDICKITYNGKSKTIKKEDIVENLINIVKITFDWKCEYIDRRYIDGNNWELVIDNKKYRGHAKYPSKFETLENQFELIIDKLI